LVPNPPSSSLQGTEPGPCRGWLQFLIGSLFLAVVVPWGTADMFDATTRMLVTLVSQAGADLDEMNAFRVQASQPRLPEVKHIWTLMFFKRESRMMAHLEKKRGFIPMAEYLAKYPDSTAAEFAPEREVYIPRERKSETRRVVLRQGRGADLLARLTGFLQCAAVHLLQGREASGTLWSSASWGWMIGPARLRARVQAWVAGDGGGWVP